MKCGSGVILQIVHPAMVSIGGQKQGASTVQPLNSLPRGGFLDGAADHDSGDDPTSPVVTCIGQVFYYSSLSVFSFPSQKRVFLVRFESVSLRTWTS